MFFFSCRNDLDDEDSWFLSNPMYAATRCDVPDVFQLAKRFEPKGEIRLEIARCGELTHFSTFAFDMPIASAEFADVLLEMCHNDFQLVPVNVEGVSQLFFIVNLLRVVDCVDEKNTKYFKRWTALDKREDKTGEYRDLFGLRIKSEKVPDGIHLFRPKGWLGVLIISQALKERLELLGANGVKFEPL